MRKFVTIFLVMLVEADRPNFIVFQPDDMPFQWDEAPESPDGKSTVTAPTPNMDRIREEGVVFTRAYTAAPKCAPSRFSVLTGRFASRGVYARQRTGESEDFTLVAVPQTKMQDTDSLDNLQTVLRDDGYQTLHAGKWHLSPTRGTVAYADYEGSVQQVLATGFSSVGGLYMDNMDKSDNLEFSHNQEWVSQEAVSFIADAHANEAPFFLYFNPTQPHAPTTYEALFNYSARQTPEGFLESTPEVDGHTTRSEVWSRAEAANGRRADLAAGVIWADDALGALINKLTALDILDRTFILVIMDHGVIAKDDLYEGGGRIAHFVRYPPAFPSGTTVATLVSNLDIAPTIFSLAGVAPSYDVDGLDWSALAAGQEDTVIATRSHLFMEISYERAVVTATYKYIMKPYGGDDAAASASNQYPAYDAEEQLYDLTTDPTEQ
eukprot:gene10665-12614_t